MIYTRLKEGKSFESVKENLGTLFDAISMGLDKRSNNYYGYFLQL